MRCPYGGLFLVELAIAIFVSMIFFIKMEIIYEKAEKEDRSRDEVGRPLRVG